MSFIIIFRTFSFPIVNKNSTTGVRKITGDDSVVMNLRLLV